MKISKIKISKFHQFEDFELDLTYPKGHEKAGKPLDKVCFIGQSGTGKTTLLEMILEAHRKSYQKDVDVIVPVEASKSSANFTFLQKENTKPIEIDLFNPKTFYPKDSISHSPLLYFPSGLPGMNLFENESFAPTYNKKNYAEIGNVKELILDASELQKVWSKFSHKISTYQIEEANFRIKLTQKVEIEGNKIDVKKEIENWKAKNINPITIVARECLDVFLNRFYLAIKTELDDKRHANSLQVYSTTNSTTIPYEHLSTGTKQIIFTAFPIYQLLEDDSIVLMDEPETSLYPDIQREIIPYYTSFDKNKTSQFFFATHSPIIASAFEPWEIVELKFDEKGKVYRDKYYEGENHVDNYKIDPRYLRWDDILTKVFDMEVDSNAEFRSAKLTEYAILKDKVKSWKEEGKLAKPTKAIEAEVAKFEKMYDLLTGNWAVTRHEKN